MKGRSSITETLGKLSIKRILKLSKVLLNHDCNVRYFQNSRKTFYNNAVESKYKRQLNVTRMTSLVLSRKQNLCIS